MDKNKKRPSVKLIAILIVIVLAAIILFQNTHEATLRLFFWKKDVSLVVLILIMLAIGFVLGWLTGKFPRRQAE